MKLRQALKSPWKLALLSMAIVGGSAVAWVAIADQSGPSISTENRPFPPFAPKIEPRAGDKPGMPVRAAVSPDQVKQPTPKNAQEELRSRRETLQKTAVPLTAADPQSSLPIEPVPTPPDRDQIVAGRVAGQ